MDIISTLENRSWIIDELIQNNLEFPKEIEKRYPNIPVESLQLIKKYKQIVAPNESSWFLTIIDYNGASDSAYKWNEWEVESLQSASDDEAWQKEIKEFWDNHFPFFISVKDGYSYLAISQQDGSVIFGEEPEFEEIERVADSFDHFMHLLANSPEKLSKFLKPD